MNLKRFVDPRKALTFTDLGVAQSIANNLLGKNAAPSEMQKKIISMANANVSILAKSTPNTGKSTGALLSILGQNKQKVGLSNIVLVPSQPLAEQYMDMLSRAVPAHRAACLYRSGNVEVDNLQHAKLATISPQTLVATPTRLLDYLSERREMVGLGALSTILVDELDLFQTDSRTNPLETLLSFMFSKTDARVLLLTSQTAQGLHFERLKSLLAQRTIKVASQEPTPCTTKIKLYISNSPNSTENETSSELAKCWKGGVVVVPQNKPLSRISSSLGSLLGCEPAIVRPGELSGINLPGLTDIYLAGYGPDVDIGKLAYTCRDENACVHVCLFSNEESAIDKVRSAAANFKLVLEEVVQ